MKSRTLLRALIGIAVSVVAIWILLRSVDLAKVAVVLGSASPAWLAVMIGTSLIDVGARAARWQILLRPIAAVPYTHVLGYTYIGYLANNVLPARLGELVRSAALGDGERLSGTTVLGTVVVERIVDTTMVVAIAAVSVLLLSVGGVMGTAVLAGVAFVGLAIGILALGIMAEPAAGGRPRPGLHGPLAGHPRPGPPPRRRPGRRAQPTGRRRGHRLQRPGLERLDRDVLRRRPGGRHRPVDPPGGAVGSGVALISIVPSGPGYVGTFEFAATEDRRRLRGRCRAGVRDGPARPRGHPAGHDGRRHRRHPRPPPAPQARAVGAGCGVRAGPGGPVRESNATDLSALGDTASVKITAIRLQRLTLPLDPPFPAAWDPVPRRSFSATLVRVETDEGVVGIGSGDTMDGFEPYKHLFIGQDPLAIERHVAVIETIDFHAGRSWPLEVALWDIAGQVAGQPVATLFGGALDGLPVYASCGMLLPAAARAESALRLRAEGFHALKIRVDPRRLEEGLAAVEATRLAVGDTMAIMVDLNQGWRMPGDLSPTIDHATARDIAARLAELDVLWLEEPLPGTDLAGLAALRATVPGIRIAGGEMTRTFARAPGRARCRRLRRPSARRGPRDRHAPGADPGRAGDGPRSLVHAAHVDERDRAAGEPARRGRRRRRSVAGVPLRPTGLDARAAGLHARRADPPGCRRRPARPDRGRAGHRAR